MAAKGGTRTRGVVDLHGIITTMVACVQGGGFSEIGYHA